MKTYIVLAAVLLVGTLRAQQVTWQEVTGQYTLPQGVRAFHGTRTSPILSAWYLDADLNVPALAIRPYLSGTIMTVPAFNSSVGAYASVNGGFFGGSSSYSAVVYPNEVKAVNVQTVARNAMSYPVIRGFFGIKNDRSCAVDWIYQFGNARTDIYKFAQPLPYAANDPTPQPAPLPAGGTQYSDLLVGIGGGPVLIKNGAINVTYNQEIMWGSGVGETNGDPRTAVGSTASKHVIMMAVDGRQAGSDGVGLPELAQMLRDLGCVEAVNLDGGGSTQMAIGNQYVNSPAGQRAVPAILSIVQADSLGAGQKPLFQEVIDTGDTNASALGGGWFESANPGYWGSTRSLLHALGTGTTYVEFRPHLPAAAVYAVYAWWVASSNRCTNTPFIITHAKGADTVRADQVQNGSTWRKIGTYEFSGTSQDRIVITDAGTGGSYVVADAVKFESFDPRVLTAVDKGQDMPISRSFLLHQSYPNPFNPTTVVGFQLPVASEVRLAIYDLLGREVAMLLNERKDPGSYATTWNASGRASGMYICRMTAGSFQASRTMLLMK